MNIPYVTKLIPSIDDLDPIAFNLPAPKFSKGDHIFIGHSPSHKGMWEITNIWWELNSGEGWCQNLVANKLPSNDNH